MPFLAGTRNWGLQFSYRFLLAFASAFCTPVWISSLFRDSNSTLALVLAPNLRCRPLGILDWLVWDVFFMRDNMQSWRSPQRAGSADELVALSEEVIFQLCRLLRLPWLFLKALQEPAR
ncbi:hypothetical protein C8J56DRAFT_1052599 [Mycena floridula]|nr:hypothetical protein C8J56DRAFT_1052599 [Mycena floridula]